MSIHPEKTLMSWSSGKDSAWGLHLLRQDPGYEVAGLFTTVNQAVERVSMHGVRLALLQKQAERLGLPLQVIDLPSPCNNSDYELIMTEFVDQSKKNGVSCFAFGDLFLEDIRRYREKQLLGTGITPVFPVWDLNTERLASEMIAAGLKTVITCVDPSKVPAELAGAEFDRAFLRALPESVDPCGENGEFHSFVYDGPMFEQAIAVKRGEIVEKEGFIYADLIPG